MKNRTFTDQMNRSVTIPFPPERVISLVPSQSELLSDLGLAERLVGITKFCVLPEKAYRSIQHVGGTKNQKHALIETLQPDLIIGNKEENQRSEIEKLAGKFPVWMSDIKSLEDALAMITSVGEITGFPEKGTSIATEIRTRFADWETQQKAAPLKKVAYLIWQNPMMVAAKGTFIDEMLQLAGFENVFREQSRYPEVSEAALLAKKPELIFLSSEPFPFKTRHIDYFHKILPESVVKLVDGQIFSWYGSRLLHVPAYFHSLHRAIALEAG